MDKFFPIINQKSGLALVAQMPFPNSKKSTITLAEFIEREDQLWFKDIDSIRSKSYPDKAITLNNDWIGEISQVHLENHSHLVQTQNWKFTNDGEIVSTNYYLQLTVIGSKLYCGPSSYGHKEKWLLEGKSNFWLKISPLDGNRLKLS